MPEFPPPIPLSGGPYDGWTTEQLSSLDHPAHGVAFFPDRIHATGPDGFAVYALEPTDEGPKGVFDPEGK